MDVGPSLVGLLSVVGGSKAGLETEISDLGWPDVNSLRVGSVLVGSGESSSQGRSKLPSSALRCSRFRSGSNSFECDSDLEFDPAGSDPSVVSFSEDESFPSSPIRGEVEVEDEVVGALFEAVETSRGCQEALAGDPVSSLASDKGSAAVARSEELLPIDLSL